MDHATYQVVYVDARISVDLDGKQVRSPATHQSNEDVNGAMLKERNHDCIEAIINEVEEVRNNLERLLRQFNGVYTCTSEKSCMANLRRLDSASPVPNPTIVFSGTFANDSEGLKIASATPILHQRPAPPPPSKELSLLKTVTYEIAKGNLSKLVVPVAVLIAGDHQCHDPVNSAEIMQPHSEAAKTPSMSPSNTKAQMGSAAHVTRQDIFMCMEAGAVDVMESPLDESRLQSLIIQTYRFHKEALHERALQIEKKRSRKLSWLGSTENKPYAYLREKMVSDLMTGICNPDQHFHLGTGRSVPALEPEREAYLKRSIGSWSYWGHEFSEDELVHAAAFMLEHALSHPELQHWRISRDKLMSFLLASRAAYNNFVDYHNFKHVIDVMQATFFFLIQLGALPHYDGDRSESEMSLQNSALASLLRPLEILTLLITAIGHDVGHPGVNNAFLVSLNAPLAQLYNDRSVLEAFHCAAFSQILRRYWRTTFESLEMRSLMINSILATDMGVHQKYMTDLGHLQDKLHHQRDLDGYSAQQIEEFRVLICALLIKCADISNVARPYNVAVQWANILQLEFANQGVMENEVGIPSTLFGGPPELHNLVKLGNSQKSFMNFFAQPLFESVADVLPAMSFATKELKKNQDAWAERIRLETERRSFDQIEEHHSSGPLSPRSRTPELVNGTSDLSVAEGLPASNPSGDDLRRLSVSQSQLAPDSQASPQICDTSSSGLPDFGEPNLLLGGQNRRSSHHKSSQATGAGTEPTEYSRRSSGALSSTSNANTMLAARRVNNSSPSQLQLAPEARSPANSTTISSENRSQNSRVSEETLSQIHNTEAIAATMASKETAKAPDDSVKDFRPDAKVIDTIRANAVAQPRTSADASFEHRGHNRSSSGAHTNNTSVSQPSPYSPAGTQATSMLTVDSDSKSAHGRVDSFPDRSSMMKPFAPLHQASNGPTLEIKEDLARLDSKDSMTSLPLHNGSLSNGVESSEQQSIRRKKSSKFNFLPWKRRAKSCADTGH